MDDSSQPPVPAADGVGWFAVWTKSRHEQVVRTQLEQKAISVSSTVPRWSRWKDRKKKVDWPLFRLCRGSAAALNVLKRRW
jgi:hypothetical protein